MSAMMGVLSLDGSPVSRASVERMAFAMPEIAPDGTSVWVDGPFGCAFQRCDDMPPPHHGPQPLHDPESGIVVMLSGRLDNRDDLLRYLGTGADPTMTDAQIALAVACRDGVDVIAKLEGDLDVASYDARERRLCVARSPVDARSFFWWSDGRRLVFAHYPRQLFSAGGIRPEVDEGMAGEMLAGFWLTPEGTLWRGVHRLPPAYALSVSRGTVSVDRWYRPDCSLLRLPSDQEYAAVFNDLFDTALKRRIGGPTGVLFSGGLDSSAIVCRSAELFARGELPVRLQPFSVQLHDENDESRWMDDVDARTGWTTERFRPAPFDWPAACQWSEQTLTLPVRPNAATLLQSMPAFHRRNVRVVLLGEGGDDWMSGSLDYLADLLRRGEWRHLFADGLRGTRGFPLWSRVLRMLHHSIGPWIRPGMRARATLPHVHPDRHFGSEWIDPAWASRIGLLERRNQAMNFPPELGLVQRGIFHNFLRGRSALNVHGPQLSAAYHHISLPMPFHDRRLAEFAFRLPGAVLRRGGVGKYLLRVAMQGTLPPALARRVDKGNFSPQMRIGLEAGRTALGAGDWAVVQSGWVPADRLDALWVRVQDDVNYVGPLWFVMALEIWLRHAVPAARAVADASH